MLYGCGLSRQHEVLFPQLFIVYRCLPMWEETSTPTNAKTTPAVKLEAKSACASGTMALASDTKGRYRRFEQRYARRRTAAEGEWGHKDNLRGGRGRLSSR